MKKEMEGSNSVSTETLNVRPPGVNETSHLTQKNNGRYGLTISSGGLMLSRKSEAITPRQMYV